MAPTIDTIDNTLGEIYRSQAIERLYLERDLYRLRQLETAVRTMATVDPAVRQLLRQWEAL